VEAWGVSPTKRKADKTAFRPGDLRIHKTSIAIRPLETKPRHQNQRRLEILKKLSTPQSPPETTQNTHSNRDKKSQKLA
jgi:hypothetical protein